jgi:hypothetical protein
MKLASLTLVAIVLPLALACAQPGSSNASAPSGADYESWTMRAAYRSGGTETIHWMYTDDPDDPSCLKDWQWYAEDGKRLVTTIRGRTTLEGATGRLWCALPVYRSGGVVGRQWKWCVC